MHITILYEWLTYLAIPLLDSQLWAIIKWFYDEGTFCIQNLFSILWIISLRYVLVGPEVTSIFKASESNPR